MTDAVDDRSLPAQPRVERCVDIDASPDEVWRTLTDPVELARWLDAEVVLDLEAGAVGRVIGADGTVRQVIVTEVEPGHLLAWHWWEDDGELSSVEITTLPHDDGTRVTVVECLAVPHGAAGAQASVALGERWQRSLVILAADFGSGVGSLICGR